MLVIRPKQLDTFELAARRQFEEELAADSKALSPILCKVIGDEQLAAIVRSAMRRAEGYGFTFRGPIRLFLELTFLCGSAFDTDPQYRTLGDVLRAHGDQMLRAQQIHEGHNDYLERVSGPGAVNVHRALRDLLSFARLPVAIPPARLVDGLLDEMARIFPQKVAYVGEACLTALIHEGIAECRNYGFNTVRQAVLIVVLMFAFGHGCTNDPLYPWIARTLRDERIVDPAARADRLERKAITWLEHVVARNNGASRT